MPEQSAILKIRAFNRYYTRVLGLLNHHILSSDVSLTEARILLEIKTIETCTAKKLIEKLEIDGGYLSRILKNFEKSELITRYALPADKRVSVIQLTKSGTEKLSELEGKSNNQIEQLLHHLDKKKQDQVLAAMETIHTALSKNQGVVLRSYRQSDLSFIVNAHRDLYHREYGFNEKFVRYVADAVSTFAVQHDAKRENIWILEVDQQPKGVIAIVKEFGDTAQLRWFLLDQSLRGKGYGHKLLDEAIQFCRSQGYEKVILWTVSDLKAARHMYKSKGFNLVEQHENGDWTSHVITEEKWEMIL